MTDHLCKCGWKFPRNLSVYCSLGEDDVEVDTAMVYLDCPECGEQYENETGEIYPISEDRGNLC